MSELTTPDQSDRLGLYITIGAAAVGIVATVITTVSRLVEVAPGKDIPVVVALDQEQTTLPLGPGGAQVSATLDAATVVVPDPAAATLFALWAQPITVGLTWIGLLVVAALFCLRLARAEVFTKYTAQLLYVGASILTAGYALGSIFTWMSSNGALAAVSDGTYDSITMTLSLAPAIGILALAAAGVAVQMGARLERETAGLV